MQEPATFAGLSAGPAERSRRVIITPALLREGTAWRIGRIHCPTAAFVTPT